MAYNDFERTEIFDKTGGECHLCFGKLTYSAYGDLGHPRGWEIDHSNPRANGGTDYFRNLMPAHISCNRQKGAMSNANFRDLYLEEEDEEDFDWLGALCLGCLAFTAYVAFACPSTPFQPEGRING